MLAVRNDKKTLVIGEHTVMFHASLSEDVCHLSQVCQGAQQQEEVSLGLLYTILVEPQAAAKVCIIQSCKMC